jgi:hypothetical protein
MKRRTRRLKLYTVVDVWRGMAASVKNFKDRSDAQNHLQRLRRRRNLAEDDLQLFETSVRV